MLKLNTITRRPGATHRPKRVGRGKGSGLGKTAGRGTKGQTSRSGFNIPQGFEGGQNPLYRRIPKKGFTNIHRLRTAIVNVKDLEGFNPADFPEVSLDTLRKARKVKGQYDRLAVLGTGELTKSFKIKAHKVTDAAKAKIEKAGGSVEKI